MNYVFNHFNFNVRNLDKSLAFYKEALGLLEARRRVAPDGSYILCFLSDPAGTPFQLELTWLRDHPQPYDLGEEEYHLGFITDDYDAAHKKHQEMGCICYENPSLGIYFIADPDGYWLEVVPRR